MKKLTKDQKNKIGLVLAYHNACKVMWNKSEKESQELACKMIEEIILK